MRKRKLVGLAAVIGMALSACGGDGGGSSATTTGTSGIAAPEASQPGAGPVAGSPAGAANPVAAAPGAASTVGATVNAPPVIGGAPITLISTATRYEFQPTASDPDGDALRFSGLNLPPWVTLDPATGRIAGQPGPADTGVFGPITLSVSDGAHEVSLPDFEIRVEAGQGKGLIRLSWQLPSLNEDGSAIDRSLQTRIYFGHGPRAYEEAYTVPGRGTTRHVLTGLKPGVWYVATTAVDPEGLESAFSDEAVAVVN